MSNMLKYAAMSLLSRTLQTFLYKYLLDVDVEGVAMPSFLDADGHSGWGVRLCNVRLREGVELMTLPGKRKVRVRRPKSKETDAPKESSISTGVPSEAVDRTDSATISRNVGESASSVAAAESPVMQSLDESARSSMYGQSQSMPISPDDYYDDGESDVSGDAAPRSGTVLCRYSILGML